MSYWKFSGYARTDQSRQERHVGGDVFASNREEAESEVYSAFEEVQPGWEMSELTFAEPTNDQPPLLRAGANVALWISRPKEPRA